MVYGFARARYILDISVPVPGDSLRPLMAPPDTAGAGMRPMVDPPMPVSTWPKSAQRPH